MKKIYTIFSILFITSIYAQIEYKIKNVKVNGILIAHNDALIIKEAKTFNISTIRPFDLSTLVRIPL